MRSSRVWRSSLVLSVLLACGVAQASGGAVSLERLLSAFASMPGLEARFVEEKTMSLLAAPLKSEGTIYFAPPGHLLRRVESPKKAELLVSGGRLRVSDGEKVDEMDLSSRDDVRPLVEALLWIFTGDRASLERAFHVGFERGETWTLSLRPKRAPLDRLVDELRLTGEGLAVTRVEVRESSGDRSVMRILEADPARTFDDEEMRRLFGVRAR